MYTCMKFMRVYIPQSDTSIIGNPAVGPLIEGDSEGGQTS